jgi:hypothetical protein
MYARKQTGEQKDMSEQGRKGPFADITTDIMSGRALHTKNKSRGDRPPYSLWPPVGIRLDSSRDKCCGLPHSRKCARSGPEQPWEE